VAAAIGIGAYEWLRPSDERILPVTRASAPALECPADQLPDDGVCIPVPPLEETPTSGPAPIELLPGRVADYERYLTPIAARSAAPAAQGLGLFVAAPRGVPVTAIELEAQTGPTRRWVTATTPPRLLTVHRVERSGATRTYVLEYDGLAFDAAPGASDVDVGTPLGRVAASSGVTGLGLSVRQVRRGVDVASTAPERLLLDSSSLACDPRNVLPSKPAATTPP
jgi:hypothetical protein